MSETTSYINNFKEIEEFKTKQDKQKQRGLNNYNILTSVLKESDEVRLHSRMIFSLLNPFGLHYQSTLFLDKFLDVLELDKTDFNINSESCSVYKEYSNIDLYITDGHKHIIIENKVYTKDQEKQIERYIKEIKIENDKLDENDILVIYLTLDKEEPSVASLGDLKIENGFIIERDLKKFLILNQFIMKKRF